MDHLFFVGEFKKAQLKERSPLTVSAYLTDLKQFSTFYQKDIDKLTTDEVEDWKNSMLGLKLKPKTINRKLVSLRRFIAFLNNCPEYGKRILAEIKLFKIQKQEYLEDTLLKSDLDRIVRVAEDNGDFMAAAVFWGMYYTGARVSEILQLNAGDVESDFVAIRGKGGKMRDLFIPNTLKKYLAACVMGRAENAPLFLNKKGKALDRQTVHNWIKRYAGIGRVKLSRAHSHNLRHLFCFSLLENDDCNLDDVANLAGHADINTTRIYTQKTKRQLLRTINNLNNNRRT